MPVIAIAVDPVTRIEGHLKVDIEADTVGGVQQITQVKTVGTLFRGFEKLMEGRDPRDAPIITSRICGVCPTSHAQVAAMALDQAAGVTVPTSGRLLRNLVHAACYLNRTSCISICFRFRTTSRAPACRRGRRGSKWTAAWTRPRPICS